MSYCNFLDKSTRDELESILRQGVHEYRVGRRANALLLLDDGMSCEAIAKVLYMDDDTIRYWLKLYQEKGMSWLAEFGYKGRKSELSSAEQNALKQWVSEKLPHTTAIVCEWIEQELGVIYSRSGATKLLERLGMEYRKPKEIARKLDPAAQAEFIKSYEAMMNHLSADEAVVFADAVHPTHAARPAGCWAAKDVKVVIQQTSGRDRLNIHGAIDLETGKTSMLNVETVNAVSTIALLSAIQNSYPNKRKIHVFLDNARYHHAEIVREWLKNKDCRIVLHFIPPYCPHLNPIERLWLLMHKNLTHNRCYTKFADFKNQILSFLQNHIPNNWKSLCDSVTDNFRIINADNFRVIKA